MLVCYSCRTPGICSSDWLSEHTYTYWMGVVGSGVGHSAELTMSWTMLQRVHCRLFHIFLMIHSSLSEAWILTFLKLLFDDGTRCQWVIWPCCNPPIIIHYSCEKWVLNFGYMFMITGQTLQQTWYFLFDFYWNGLLFSNSFINHI